MHESMPLGQRHAVEEEFHDRKARRTRPRSAHVDFYSVVNEEHCQKLLDAAGSLKGKRVLDFWMRIEEECDSFSWLTPWRCNPTGKPLSLQDLLVFWPLFASADKL